MSLTKLLLSRRDAIAQRWLEKTVQSYSPDAAKFFKREKNQFANPVGHVLATGTRALVDALAADSNEETLSALLEPILKVRSVQELSASQAVSFVFLLKDAVREELSTEGELTSNQRELSELDLRVDHLALLAFDGYTACREKLHQIRVDDVKRRISGLMRRLGIGFDDSAADPDVRPEDLRREKPAEK